MPPSNITAMPEAPVTGPNPIQREKVVVANLFKAVEAVTLRDDMDAITQAINNYFRFLETIGLRTMVGIESPV